MVILYPAAWLKIEFVGKIGVKLTEPTDSENESKDIKDQETGEAASKVDARAASVIFATFTAFLTTGLKQTQSWFQNILSVIIKIMHPDKDNT